jgi:hypothetical protein
VFDITQTMLGLFNMLTNFTLAKFDELATLMVPTIVSHAQSIGADYNLASN